MAGYTPRRVLEEKRLEKERTGITEEMEAISALSSDLRRATAENIHNFRQLQNAGFPGSVVVEVVFRTYRAAPANLAKFLGFDVEMYEHNRPKHAIVAKTLRGYPIRMSSGTTPEPWYPPESFALGSTKQMALSEKGKVHVMDENQVGRGCLVVSAKNFMNPPGSVEDPKNLSTEFSFHLHQLTAQALDEAGVEYIPFEPEQ